VPFLFCKALSGRKVDDLVEKAGKGGGGAAAGPAAVVESKVEAKKEEKKEEVVEDVQLGGGLFGDDDEDW